MDRDEVGKLLAESVRKRRGYADFFDWPNKSVKEWGIAQSFVEELERNNGPKIIAGKQHPGGPDHAPDWQLTTERGESWGVELTELVCQKAIEETKQRGLRVQQEWTDDHLIKKFTGRVAQKDCPDKVRGGSYDRYILLVHTDEPMLPAKRLDTLLRRCTFQTRLIDDIYVLVSYDPSVGHQPLLHFAVTKAAAISPG